MSAPNTLPSKVVTRQLLRITTAGSVDDGKSTLIGRLLHDTDSLPLDHLEAVTDEEGTADLAALSDGYVYVAAGPAQPESSLRGIALDPRHPWLYRLAVTKPK